MNHQNRDARILRRIALILSCSALLSSAVSLSACQKPDPPAETLPVGTAEPETLPDLTDDREPTDLTEYADRLNTLFAETPVSPESDFTFESAEDGMIVTGYTGGDMVVVIPDTLGGSPVVGVAEGAFADQTSLKALSIPNTVRTVGKGALKGCKELTSLRTPVFTCPDAPWFGALFGAQTYEINGSQVPAKLSTLVITEGVGNDETDGVTVPDYCFYACRGLEVVSLPATTAALGNFAFYGCEGLVCINTEYTALVTVGQKAFTNCRALLNLSLPDTVLAMGFAMLEGCSKLETLTIPFVGGYSADLQYALTEEEKQAIKKGEMTDPDDTRYLGYLFGASVYSFTEGYLPDTLITVTLLDGCKTIPANAFFECASVRCFVLPEGVTTIERRAFYGCEAMGAVEIPDSVITVGDDAFSGCIRMTAFDGGESLSELGIQAFLDCVSLKTVTLPATVTHLPNSCFAGCVSLETLTAEGVKTQGKQVFRNCPKLSGWDRNGETTTKP